MARLAAVLLLVLGGCGQFTAPLPTADIALVRSFVLEETDSLFLGRFWSLAVTTAPYRVYVPDTMGDQVGVFDSLGRIVRYFGSPGQGPGELDYPDNVLVRGSAVYVAEDGRFSVFDTSGTFRRIMHLPEGVYRDDRWSMGFYKERLVIPADDSNQRSGLPFKRTLEEPTVAIVDTLFESVRFMGQYPAYYREGEYVYAEKSIDIGSRGLMAVSYVLLNQVDLYDLEHPGRLPLRTIQMDHPNWKPTTVEIPPSMPIPQVNELHVNTSDTQAVYIVKDRFLVLHFWNASPDYEPGDDRTVEHFAVVATIDGEHLAALALPGPIMAKNDRDQLYIRLSSIPDQMEIGVYELVVE